MGKKQKNAISPTRSEDYPEWYQQVIKAADLAEASPVRGCMVIKPWGWSIWENMQRALSSAPLDRAEQEGHNLLLLHPVGAVLEATLHRLGLGNPEKSDPKRLLPAVKLPAVKLSAKTS